MYMILAIIVFGMVIGAIAQFILGREEGGVNWTMAIVAGIAGSFVGGLVGGLLTGDGLDFQPSGVIGSIIGAILVTGAWRYFAAPTPAKDQA
jgi:uncharacterized membrane protein YeaQ/YmgE (transglycosylase-associated protein family)